MLQFSLVITIHEWLLPQLWGDDNFNLISELSFNFFFRTLPWSGSSLTPKLLAAIQTRSPWWARVPEVSASLSTSCPRCPRTYSTKPSFSPPECLLSGDTQAQKTALAEQVWQVIWINCPLCLNSISCCDHYVSYMHGYKRVPNLFRTVKKKNCSCIADCVVWNPLVNGPFSTLISSRIFNF